MIPAPPLAAVLAAPTGAAAGAGRPLGALLAAHAGAEPLDLVATALFLLAILHTFAAPALAAAARRLDARLAARRGARLHSARVELLRLLGEVEVVFGLWAVPLLLAIAAARGSRAAGAFLDGLDFAEPIFVVAVMAIASTGPVLGAAEAALGRVARLGGGSPAAWWFVTLSLGPLLGSLVTEPAAMVISALLLGRRVLDRGPSRALRHATLGLLFVDVSVGGTLTSFAAPPVLMVAGRFGWDTPYVLSHLGWKAAIGILLSNALVGLVFRRELAGLGARSGGAEAGAAGEPGPEPAGADRGAPRPPAAIAAIHLAFLAFTVAAAHTPALVVGGFLLFLAFQRATAPHQRRLDLRPPLLVGLFLAGLVVHGAFQRWWLGPVLARLGPLQVGAGATLLTAFNDNAAITYLAALVPGFDPALRLALVAGAVTGGGLTVIANAPNPAGQAVLARHFPDGVSPLGLLAGGLGPTLVVGLCFALLP